VSADRRPLVFVTVGTDHHPFDRLVDWVDAWLETPGAAGVRCVVQHGTSKAPRVAERVEYLPHDEMERLSREAVAIVCHGGPGSVMLVRWNGKKPIAVPRRHRLGEHVDDHQLVFTRRMAQEGELELIEDETAFRRALESVVSGARSLELPPPDEGLTDAHLRFSKLMDELLQSGGTRRRRARSGRRRRAAGPGLPPTGRQKVLYIGGWGRSGSTLFERMLGELPGFVSIGEVREIWQRSLIEERPCGCGEPFLSCPFWSEVGRVAYGGWDRIDLREVHDLRYRLDRGFAAPRLMAGGGSTDLRRYLSWLRPLYQAVAEVGGARVIVDSSKLPTHALILRKISELDVRVVHLVRDSRGVAWSWQKRVQAAVGKGEPRYLYRYSAMGSALRYDFYNSLTAAVRRIGVPYLRQRYEDLIADPATHLAAAARFMEEDVGLEDLAFIGDGEVRLGPAHTADGNPMRFAVGSVPLREDDEWRRHMAPRDRLSVAALTAPLLLRYGYGRVGGRR
jgi:UDP-N-acetylglucosamine transferase subunit ALG13